MVKLHRRRVVNLAGKSSLVSENKKQLEEGVPGDNLIIGMLKIKHCTICDRPAPVGSREYLSIQSHLDANKSVKILDPEMEDLYEKIANLKGKPSYIITRISNIDKEITTHKISITEALFQRNRKNKELENVREKIKEIIREKGHEILNLNPNNINQTLVRVRGDKYNLIKNINRISNELMSDENELKNHYIEIGKLKNIGDKVLIEEELIKYTEFLKTIINNQTLKERTELIEKIQETANSIQNSVANINNIVVVSIEIDKNDYTLRFVDANGNPNPGHGAQNTLAKMSIINAIVKLSNDKKNKNYPFIADAPTSDFAYEFTDRFFDSVSNTYEQIIILTKDLTPNIEIFREKQYVKNIIEIKKECNEEIPLSTNSITIIK